MLLVAITMSTSLMGQTFSGGDGSSGDPYIIATAADLIELSKTGGGGGVWAKFFIQSADIDFGSDETLVDWDGDGTADWDAADQLGMNTIGDDPVQFSGSYNGQGYTISNVYINRPTQEKVGIFGFVNYSGTIENLGLIDVDISGGGFVGGFVGYLRGAATIVNCYVTGSVSGTGTYVGGFVGYIRDDNTLISKCYSTANVSGSSNYAGGFVGVNNAGSTISNCYSMGNVTRTSSTNNNYGGFAGYNGNTTTIGNERENNVFLH